MSILSDFEDRVANAVEGVFAGAFRSPVQPVELAKALAKAMDDGRAVGVGKVYAPTSYTVALSREDRRNLGEFTTTLEGELSTYLTDHAREAGYTLTSKPRVRFDTHSDLRLGRFRVSAGLAGAAGADEDDEAAAAFSEQPEPAAAAPVEPNMPIPPVRATPRGVATVTTDDHDIVLSGQRMVVGRLRDCDICLADVNVSREHAAFVRSGEGWSVEDLDSTNGTFVNGRRVAQAELADGDTVEAGASRLVYHSARDGA
jgi:hypothetical protein